MNDARSSFDLESEAEALLKGVPDLVTHFAATQTTEPSSVSDIKDLLNLINKLHKLRSDLTKKPECNETCKAISSGMLVLSEACLQERGVDLRQRLKCLSNICVVVDEQPDLLENMEFRKKFFDAMIEACDKGLQLQADREYIHLLQQENGVKDLHKLVDQIRSALVEHFSEGRTDDDETIKKASEYLGNRKQEDDACKLLSAIETALSCSSQDVNQCHSNAEHFSQLFIDGSKEFRVNVMHKAVFVFILLNRKRDKNTTSDELKQQLTRVMLALNAALRSRSEDEVNLIGRFHDLCQFQQCVQYDEALMQVPENVTALRNCITEAYQIGLKIRVDPSMIKLFGETPGKGKVFLSNFEKIRHAYGVDGCVLSSQPQEILQQAFLQSKAEKLMKEASDLVANFSNAPNMDRKEAIQPIVNQFNDLRRLRCSFLQPECREKHMEISRGMLALNEVLLQEPNAEPRQRLKSLYNICVVVDEQPDLLENMEFRKKFFDAMIEACHTGLTLNDDQKFQEHLSAKADRLPKFHRRMELVCRSLVMHFSTEDLKDNEEGIVKKASEYFNTRGKNPKHEKEAGLLLDIQTALSCDSLDFGKCLSCAKEFSQLFIAGSKEPRNNLIGLAISIFNIVRTRRGCDGTSEELKQQLTRVMLALNAALRSRSEDEVNLIGRFMDLYELHDCVRHEDALIQDPGIADELKTCIPEAYQLGQKILADTSMVKLLNEDPDKKSFFLSRLGEICRVHAVYECAQSLQLQEILQMGIGFFEKAFEVHDTLDPRHLDYNCPRLADCQIRLRQHERAIETLKMVSSPGNGIKNATAWKALTDIAQCYQTLGRSSQKCGDSEQANEYFLSAEKSYVQAVHIWEPSLNPLHESCTHEQNRTVQGQMSWLYLDWGKPGEAEQSARRFLNNQDPENRDASHLSFAMTTLFNLGTALMKKNCKEDAIQVFKDIIQQCSTPRHRIRALIALRQLYAWSNNKPCMQETASDLYEACRGADASGGAYAAIPQLPEDQLLALFDLDSMTKYIHHCQDSLSRGEALSLLKELPAMITAKKLLWPGGHGDPVLLSLLGQADLQVGNVDGALKAFQRVASIDLSQKNQGITWLLIGNTYAAQGDLEKALSAYDKSFSATQNEIAPLIKAATICRLQGDFYRALEYLDRIKKSGLDKKPDITETVRAKTLWSLSQVTNDQKDVQSACQILYDLLQNYKVDIPIRCLMDMLEHPIAQSKLTEVILKTQNIDVIKAIREGLPNQTDIPPVILEAVLSRLEDCKTSTSFGRYLVGIVVQALVRSYFNGTVGVSSFDTLANRVVGCFLAQDSDRRREWMKELLIAERGAVLREVVRGYSAAASEILKPLFSVTESNVKDICTSEFVQTLNAFLRTEFSPRLWPKNYSHTDPIDLRPELKHVVNSRISELRKNIEGGCCVDLQNMPTSPVFVSWRSWLLAKPFLEEMLKMVEGPLIELATASIWKLDVSIKDAAIHANITFDEIDPVHNPDKIMAMTDSALRDWQVRGRGSIQVDLPPFSSWHVTRDLCIKVHLVTPQPNPALLHNMKDCAAYLQDETTMVLTGGAGDPHFPFNVNGRFPGAKNKVFNKSESEWISFLRFVWDSEVQCSIKWIIKQDPAGYLHSVKITIRQLRAKMDDGDPIVASLIEKLQGQVVGFSQELAKGLKTEMRRYPPRAIDGGSCIKHFIEKSTYHQDRVKSEIGNSVYVAMHRWQLESVVHNLITNAFTALARANFLNDHVHIRVYRLEADDHGKNWMQLTITNPFSKEIPPDLEGTGIGLKTVKHIVEDLNDGRLHICKLIPDEGGESIYSVTVLIPLADGE